MASSAGTPQSPREVLAKTPFFAGVLDRALSPLVAASPELADRFAAMLKKRQGELDRAYRGDSRWSISGLGTADVAGVIRGFFAGAV